MAQPLNATQAKYLNYLKLAAGKFHDLFGGQFFFDVFCSRITKKNDNLPTGAQWGHCQAPY